MSTQSVSPSSSSSSLINYQKPTRRKDPTTVEQLYLLAGFTALQLKKGATFFIEFRWKELPNRVVFYSREIKRELHPKNLLEKGLEPLIFLVMTIASVSLFLHSLARKSITMFLSVVVLSAGSYNKLKSYERLLSQTKNNLEKTEKVNIELGKVVEQFHNLSKETIDDRKRQLLEIDRENKSLAATNKSLQKTCTYLKGQVSSLEKVHSLLEGSVLSLNNNIEKMGEQTKGYKEQNEVLTRSTSQLQDLTNQWTRSSSQSSHSLTTSPVSEGEDPPVNSIGGGVDL